MKRLAMATAIVLCCMSSVSASEQVLKDYIQTFTGRWVCEEVADEDVEGYWSKGDQLRYVIIHTATEDQSGLRFDWQVEKDGKVVGTAKGITFWDPSKKCLRSISFAKPGFLADTTHVQEGDAWLEKSCVTFPDGSQGTATVTINASDNGKTHTNVLTQRVSHEGQAMPDVTRVWKKVSKNHEMLEKHLGWLIGTWTGTVESPELGSMNFTWDYAWISDGDAISINITSDNFSGLSIVLFDPSVWEFESSKK